MSKIIAQGAEAKIVLSNNFIIKDRIPKAYRLDILDKRIRKSRTRSETKLLEKASQIINSPKPSFQQSAKETTKIKMPFVDGKRLSTNLDSFTLKKQEEICKIIGTDVGKLHDAGIIHGDLTTSNMILVEKSNNKLNRIINVKDNNSLKNKLLTINNKSVSEATQVERGGLGVGGESKVSVFLIDFGLGYISHKTEDKAVDLHLLKQALEAKHFKKWQILWKQVEIGYKSSKESDKTIKRLEAVEKRGRYKDKY
mgnify:CR=1 FL=1